MMKRKRIAVLGLTVALCLSFMAGCVEEKETINQREMDAPKVTATVPPTEKVDSTEEEAPTAKPVYDEEF